MRSTKAIAALGGLLVAAAAGAAAENAVPQFVDLFNGKDLTGWVNVNTAPDTWKVRDGVLTCSGHPIGVMRTARQYENFVLHIEWMHMEPGGNSGVAGKPGHQLAHERVACIERRNLDRFRLAPEGHVASRNLNLLASLCRFSRLRSRAKEEVASCGGKCDEKNDEHATGEAPRCSGGAPLVLGFQQLDIRYFWHVVPNAYCPSVSLGAPGVKAARLRPST